MRELGAALLLALSVAVPAAAHVGSPHLYLEGEAGPWPVLAVVHMPPAVPGEASVGVKMKDLAPGEEVVIKVRGIPPDGEEHAPPWTVAERSAVDPGFWSAPIPLYVFGSWEAEVLVEGARGEGRVRVPFHAEVPRPTDIPTGLAIALVLLMLLCAVSAWQMWRGLGEEGVLGPGEEAARKDRFRGLCFGAFGLGLVVFFVAFTLYTWSIYDKGHWAKLEVAGFRMQAQIAQPPARAERSNTLQFVLLDSGGALLEGLQPIDGELVHLTVVQLDGAGEIHHSHPRPVAQASAFQTSFRPERPGSYRIYAETRADDGRLVTVTHDLQIGAGTPQPGSGDAIRGLAAPVGGLPPGSLSAELGDGFRLDLVGEGGTSLEVDEFRRWEFELRGPDGAVAAPLEPVERGELGHLFVHRLDGEVFVRLVPSGSVGGAAPAIIEEEPGRVGFPYAFPEPGSYRLWVQVRHAGVDRIGAFDVTVRPQG